MHHNLYLMEPGNDIPNMLVSSGVNRILK